MSISKYKKFWKISNYLLPLHIFLKRHAYQLLVNISSIAQIDTNDSPYLAVGRGLFSSLSKKREGRYRRNSQTLKSKMTGQYNGKNLTTTFNIEKSIKSTVNLINRYKWLFYSISKEC